eukprot:UC1_evm1s736
MAREEMRGPAFLAERSTTKEGKREEGGEEEEEEEEEEENYPIATGSDDERKRDEDALRAYQLQRLRYYYAVVECDTSATAQAVYEQCDGLEYEATGNIMDLRFIPADMAFEQEARDRADALPSTAFVPEVDFNTAALQHSRPKLTWDEDDAGRTRITKRKFSKNELREMDFD